MTDAPELWTRYQPLAYGIARDFFIPGAERKDTEQEALIGLWEACRDYDPSKGPFEGFARLVVRRRVMDAVTVARREKHTVLTHAGRTAIDADGDEVSILELLPGGHDPADVAVAREQVAVLVDAARALSDTEREGLAHVVNGFEYAGNKRIDNAIQRAKRKLVRALEDGGVTSLAHLIDSRDCIAADCPNEATGADRLCDHCRKWGRKPPPAPRRPGKGARLELVHSRRETPVARKTCSVEGCDNQTISDRGRYARVCHTHKALAIRNPRLAAVSDQYPPPELGPPTPGDHDDAQRLEAAYGERHPASVRFHELLAELGELHDRKQADYGLPGDPFANVRAAAEWGLEPWVGAMVRATDKVRRLQTMAQRGTLANESAEDSLRDIAVYAVIALVLLEEAA